MITIIRCLPRRPSRKRRLPSVREHAGAVLPNGGTGRSSLGGVWGRSHLPGSGSGTVVDRNRERKMRRKTLDALLVSAGLVMAIVLLVGGILLTWGYNFANSNVRDQLKQQNIFFPPKGSP